MPLLGIALDWFPAAQRTWKATLQGNVYRDTNLQGTVRRRFAAASPLVATAPRTY